MHTELPSKNLLDDKWSQFLKRGFDIVVSLCFLCLVFPFLLLLVFVVTECTMPGKLFFVQKRTGLNGKTFKCYKFRSMRQNPHSEVRQATKGDERVTRWGYIMRKTSLDETPQFINVLMGDMSIVGPRPHMLKHTDEFTELVDGYMLRHQVKPGVTGWSQVNGYRGEIRRVEDIKNRVKYDLWYIDNWSFFLDIRIIFQTMTLCFGNDRNAL
jgi:putative colanic acid biosynthesis UDP-glucose lipid carrier transferase